MTVYFFMKFIIDNNGQLWVQLIGFIDSITLEYLHKHLYKRINYTLVLISVNLLISKRIVVATLVGWHLQICWTSISWILCPISWLKITVTVLYFHFYLFKRFSHSFLRLWLYFRNIKREMRPKERRTSVNSFVITISLTIARRSNKLFYLYRNMCTLLTYYLLFYL